MDDDDDNDGDGEQKKTPNQQLQTFHLFALARLSVPVSGARQKS